MKVFNVENVFLGILIVILAVAIIAAWPLAIIWALNCLFPLLSIPYGFSQWLAVIIINWTTFGGLSYSIRKVKEQ